jgi:capsular polysaccharide biosynthesis protein
METSQMATDLEHRQEGETFTVLDAPNFPSEPTFPKPLVFASGGLMAGIVLGLLVIVTLEYRDTALRTERDVWAFTQLPTLAVIAYSVDISASSGRLGRIRRLFGRKPPKELLAGNPG